MSTEEDPRAVRAVIGGVEYSSPLSFDDVAVDDFRMIGNIPWLHRPVVLVDAESYFAALGIYAWDGKFYWGVARDALRSGVWGDAIAFDTVDLTTRGGMAVKSYRHIRDIRKGLMTMPVAPIVYANLNVDLWSYRTFRERYNVKKLCALPAEQLEKWSGQFDVHLDAICWNRPFLKCNFRYEDRSSSTYWTVQLPWERRKLSALGRFCPYHLQGVYNLGEGARNRMVPLIPGVWSRLAISSGFRFDQEPIFLYKARALIE